MTSIAKTALTALLATATLLVGPVDARAETVTLDVQPMEAQQDADVAVPVRIENPQGLGALQLLVTYDPARLEGKGAEAGDVLAGIVEAHVIEPGRMRVALVTNAGVHGAGILLRLSFRTRATGAASIGLAEAKAWQQETGHAMAVGARGGTLTVGGTSAAEDVLPMPLLIGAGIIILLGLLVIARRRAA